MMPAFSPAGICAGCVNELVLILFLIRISVVTLVTFSWHLPTCLYQASFHCLKHNEHQEQSPYCCVIPHNAVKLTCGI